MNKIYVVILCFFSSLHLYGYDISGQWKGVLHVQNIELHLVFHISNTDDLYTATMDSPDQGAYSIPVSKVEFVPPKLSLEITGMGIVYEGNVLSEKEIEGTFTQMGKSFPLNLEKSDGKKEALLRPQEPKAPFPYYTEEVTFNNEKDGFELAGTLTLPKQSGIFPAVILISGSGQQNRDEELFGHKPFLVLADHLTKKGIAVLRFDDRGTGSSKGNYSGSNTKDFAVDVEFALKYLKTRKEIDKTHIGLIGHSEGGMIAPMVAVYTGDVFFMVLMAGTAIPGDELLLIQQRLIAQAYGTSEAELEKAHEINEGAYNIIKSGNDNEELKKELSAYFEQKYAENEDTEMSKENADKLIKAGVKQLTSPWMSFFIKYDPAPMLTKVDCPVLAINGSKDLQVTAGKNLGAIKKALHQGGNTNVTVKEFPNLNHLFQNCEKGTPLEYGKIEETIAPIVLNEISNWITDIVK